MKNKNLILKPLTLILSVLAIMFTFASCEYKPEPPEENAFSLVMDFAQTKVKVGNKVTYKAILKNAEHETFTLQHSAKLIYISVVKAENYKDEKPILSSLAESNIAPHGQIEEFYEFEPDEKGEYILKAYTLFSIEGKEITKDYNYECEEIKITVV